MTLTHQCDTPWVESCNDSPLPNETRGITDFGLLVVAEMNRIGMIVDLSHTANVTQITVLQNSLAPVLFTHSNVYDASHTVLNISRYALCPNVRNVDDYVLDLLKINGGVVGVTACGWYVNCSHPYQSTLDTLVDMIDYVVERIGVDHVGIGSDFDGCNPLPSGFTDTSMFPNITAELIRRGQSRVIVYTLIAAVIRMMKLLKSLVVTSFVFSKKWRQ